MYRTLTGLHTA